MAVRKVDTQATESRLSALSPPAGPPWAAQARRDALSALRATGLPQRRDEYWRFTRPDTLNAAEAPAAKPFRHGGAPFFEDTDALRIVFAADNRPTQ